MTFSCNNSVRGLVAGKLVAVHAEYVMWVTIGLRAAANPNFKTSVSVGGLGTQVTLQQ